MKRFLMLMLGLGFVLLFTSCDKPETKTDNDLDDNDIVDIDDVDDDAADPDIDVPDVDNQPVCTLDSTWMTPADEWVSWSYLKIMGEILDYDGEEYVEAVFTDGKIKLVETTTELTIGSVQNYQGSVLLADAVEYEFLNQTATSATVDYWDAMYQFSAALIPAMKEQGVREAGFGATMWFRHSFIDLEISGQSITAQHIRKNCFLALSKTEEVEEEGETYDVPIGDMYGCYDDNIDGSVGEDLKMMFKNQLTEDEAEMLEFFNTQTDGTVLQYGEEGYTHICSCFEADGVTEVNCWNEYDGPGGTEDCPAVVEAAGECGTVDPDEDVVPDEDADGISTKMVPCDQTDVTVPANAAIVVVDVEVTWNGTEWSVPAKCLWACNTDYDKEGETCINTKSVDCLPISGKPSNSHDVITQHNVTFTTAGGWTTAPICAEWACDASYDKEGETCINEKDVFCDAVDVVAPANGHIVTDEIVHITYDGTSWSYPDKCEWACDSGYAQEGETCINEKDVLCDATDVVAPANGHVVTDEMVTVTYDGASWSYPDKCEWACDSGYAQEGEACVNEKDVLCDATDVTAPANGHVVADEMVIVTYDGTSWSDPEKCEWACDSTFHSEDATTCVSDTKMADCTDNAPENATSITAQVEITWTGTEWPVASDCEWSCDNCYVINGPADGCDFQAVVFVNYAAAGNNDGTNWTDAKTDLSDAIDNSCEGQQIWVAKGTYHPTTCPNLYGNCISQREYHFTVMNGVGIYGGFDGTEVTLEQRDWQNNETILSGDFNNDDETVGNAENAYHVFFHDGWERKDSSAILDGFTITGGNADGDGWPNQDGGGMRSGKFPEFGEDHISFVVRNSIFKNNATVNSGGAFYVTEGASPVIENCVFVNNNADKGGAIYTWQSSISINDSTFTENEATVAGAVGLSESYSSIISNCLFENNSSSENAGAVRASGEIIISESVFSGNSSVSGGAITIDDPGTQIIDGCYFYNNTATGTSLPQGLAGALGIADQSTATISNSVFENNTAAIGGAVAIMRADPTFINCTIADNSASVFGGGIANIDSDVYILNTIVWNSTGENIYNLPAGNPWGMPASDPQIANSNIGGCGTSAVDWNTAACGTDNGGNIDEDPLFVGTGDDPLMLAAGSPCIDAGDNDYIPVGITTDILGYDRIINTTVNMGAYEFNPCDPNPCGGTTPACIVDMKIPEGYACYPTVGWCVTQHPKTYEGFVGDMVDVYGRVWIDGITNITTDAVDVSPLVKAQIGIRPVGGVFESDSWLDAIPNPAGGSWGNNDEYMVIQHEMAAAGEFDYAFRFSADGGQNWTVCDTEDDVLGNALVHPVVAGEVRNSGFEYWNGTTNAPLKWVNGTGLSVEKESTLFYSGAASAKLTRILDDNAAAQILSDFVEVTASTSYTVSGWFLDRFADNGRGRLMVSYYDSSKTFISPSIYDSVYTSDSDSWQKMQLAITTPANAAYVKVGMRLYKPVSGTPTTGNIVYVDDFSLE